MPATSTISGQLSQQEINNRREIDNRHPLAQGAGNGQPGQQEINNRHQQQVNNQQEVNNRHGA